MISSDMRTLAARGTTAPRWIRQRHLTEAMGEMNNSITSTKKRATLEETLSIWWAVAWRHTLASTLAGAFLGFVGGFLAGDAHTGRIVGVVLAWVGSIPCSIWALREGLYVHEKSKPSIDGVAPPTGPATVSVFSAKSLATTPMPIGFGNTVDHHTTTTPPIKEEQDYIIPSIAVIIAAIVFIALFVVCADVSRNQAAQTSGNSATNIATTGSNVEKYAAASAPSNNEVSTPPSNNAVSAAASHPSCLNILPATQVDVNALVRAYDQHKTDEDHGEAAMAEVEDQCLIRQAYLLSTRSDEPSALVEQAMANCKQVFDAHNDINSNANPSANATFYPNGDPRLTKVRFNILEARANNCHVDE